MSGKQVIKTLGMLLIWAFSMSPMRAGDIPALKAADTIIVPDQDVAGFKFSAMQLAPSIPALNCVVTGPPDTSANLAVLVLLFDSQTALLPYAQVGGSATVQANKRALCDLNNGQQVIPQKTPKKIEIQLSTTAAISKNQPVLLP